MLVVTKNKLIDMPMPKLRHVKVHFYLVRGVHVLCEALVSTVPTSISLQLS